MNFLIADTFSKSLDRLTAQEQAASKITVFDLQSDPAAPGLKFHRIDRSKDQNFWSIRVNGDIRIIVHKTKASFLVAYVDHHDDAYAWAERRRIDTHPTTGAAQIVEVRERVEDIAPPVAVVEGGAGDEAHPLFWALGDDDLLGAGVPEDWLADVKAADDTRFLEIYDHLPVEAAEALSTYADTGLLTPPEPPVDDPFTHPDAQRRFRVLDDVEALQRALDAPWERWAVFLHPAQERIAATRFNGPARVAGSAGTGKTVVALHRAARALKADVKARVLVTTFARPLAKMLAIKLRRLVTEAEFERATIASFKDAGRSLYALARGHEPRYATNAQVMEALRFAAADLSETDFDIGFLTAEFSAVVDTWRVASLEAYAKTPRLGRKTRIGAKQRARLWPVFERAREMLAKKGLSTPPMVYGKVEDHWTNRDDKPFTAIIVDEAQDLGPSELRMLTTIAGPNADSLFFAGDLGQRIFQEAFSWKTLGIDIRGRSRTLKVNYRTSHQIRLAADRLLASDLSDVDGIKESRAGTVSIFNGPKPEANLFDNAQDEIEAVGRWISARRSEGMAPEEIGVFVRGGEVLSRARQAIEHSGESGHELSARAEERIGSIAFGSMHLAKGLEFRAVVVMACDDAVLPLEDRLESVTEESDLEEIYETERRLFYVACTRARDVLLVTAVAPGSVFLRDIDDGCRSDQRCQ